MTELLEEYMSKMKEGRNFTSKQIEFIAKYDKKQEMNGIAGETRKSRIRRLFQLFEAIGKDFEDITEQEIDNYIYNIKKRKVTSYTYESYKNDIKYFFKGTPIENAQCLVRGLFEYPKKTSKDLLIEEQVMKSIEKEDNTQHKAIIAILWETGCRPGELCACNVEDFVEIGNKCKIILRGKTGTRERTLLISDKYMKFWISVHPFKNQPKKPLFISMSHNRFHQRITDWTLSHIVRNASKKAGITKNITPYTFRHSRATHLASFMTEMELRHYFGWTKNSTMPGTYIHLSGKHIDDKYESIVTGKKEKLEPQPSILLPKECANCKESIEPTATYCYRCGYKIKLKLEEVERDTTLVEMFRSNFAKSKGIDLDSLLNEFQQYKGRQLDMAKLLQRFLKCFNGGNVIQTKNLRQKLSLDESDAFVLMGYLVVADLIEIEENTVKINSREDFEKFIPKHEQCPSIIA